MQQCPPAPSQTRPPVNASLTINARRDVVENPEFAAFARRVIRAYSRRVGRGDVEGLRDLVALSNAVDDAIVDAISGLKSFGYSWQEIADRLAMSKQGVQQRWGSRRP